MLLDFIYLIVYQNTSNQLPPIFIFAEIISFQTPPTFIFISDISFHPPPMFILITSTLLGLADADEDSELLGLTLKLSEDDGLTELLGEMLGDSELLGEILGLTLGDIELDGL